MKGKCLDEGILQGYLDGELSAAQTREAETHLAACASCMAALREAESELSFFSATFAPDPSVSVPTELLRTRLEAAVEALESAPAPERRRATWKLKGWLSALVAPLAFAPQRAGAYAGVAAVVVFAVIFVSLQTLRPRPTGDPTQDARPETAAVTPAAPQAAQSTASNADQSTEVEPLEVASNETGRRESRLAQVKFNRAATRTAAPTERVEASVPTPAATQPEQEVVQKSVPGEETYQQAIASLARAVRATGDAALTPAVRADYERNLAVIDRAIEETRRAALRNPQDADATAFLFSAYQSKIDLLTAVADQTQSAALGR
ncbi:MAG TPA: zf-HC2 domain-containing protein [Pyrinomonadaceae bacterium]|nr:zf-HC2 domain-containing protein [Pyrinomonadaceae bacterium]